MNNPQQHIASVVIGDQENHPTVVILHTNRGGWSGCCKLCGMEFLGHDHASAVVALFETHMALRHG